MKASELQDSVRKVLVELVRAHENAKELSYGDHVESFAEISSEAGYDLNGAVGEALNSIEIAITALGDVETTLALTVMAEGEKETIEQRKGNTDENSS